MTRHDDRIRFQHMLDLAKEAVEMIAGKSRGDLKYERILEHALVRVVEIIGEAAARVSQETQQEYPQIPWQEIIGMRNQLIHGYDSIDANILWDTIEIDLPSLISLLEKILNE